MQLKKVSDYYDGNNLTKRSALENDTYIDKINNHKIERLSPEYFIDTQDESEEATEVFSRFLDGLDNKSMTSNKDEDLEDELIPGDNNEDDDKINTMLKSYYKEENIFQNDVIEVFNCS